MDVVERETIIPILQDDRSVEAVWLNTEVGYIVGIDDTGYKITVTACDEIHVYGEPGPKGYYPWFAIKKDGAVIARVNAAQVSVVSYA